MTTKTAAKKPASKSSTKTAAKSPTLGKISAAVSKGDLKTAQAVARSTPETKKLQASVGRAEQLLKKHRGNVERAMDEAGATGDVKTVAALNPQPKAPAVPAAPEPKKAAKSEAKRGVISGGLKITVVAAANPRRAGTLGAKTFGLYKTGMTVAEWRDLCRERDADAGYLHADLRAGYIKVG